MDFDALDDAHWINLQDPIKQMFLAITKAIKSQASGIRDLDRKCSEFVTFEGAESLVKRSFDAACTKQDATQILYQIDSKTSEKDTARLEAKLSQANILIEKLTDEVHVQLDTITDISIRMTEMEKELQLLKNPNFDQVFSYVDRQMNNSVADFERKMELKADIKLVETVLPERMENLYRTMNTKLNDMKVDIARSATKEEFQLLANQKADSNELRCLAAELSDRTTRHELQQSVNQHVSPLATAIKSMEAAMQIQENMSKQNYSSYMEKSAGLERMYQEQQEYRLSHTVNAHGGAPASVDKVYHIIDDVIRDRRLGEVNQLHLDTSLANHSEYLLKQMSVMGESVRLEIVTATREEMNAARGQLVQVSSHVETTMKQNAERQSKISKALRELSTNVATALGKKLDIRDYKKLTERELREATAAAAITSSSSSASFLRNSNNNNSSKRREEGGSRNSYSSDSTYDNQSNSVSSEFDRLLQSMCNKGSKKGSGSNSIAARSARLGHNSYNKRRGDDDRDANDDDEEDSNFSDYEDADDNNSSNGNGDDDMRCSTTRKAVGRYSCKCRNNLKYYSSSESKCDRRGGESSSSTPVRLYGSKRSNGSSSKKKKRGAGGVDGVGGVCNYNNDNYTLLRRKLNTLLKQNEEIVERIESQHRELAELRSSNSNSSTSSSIQQQQQSQTQHCRRGRSDSSPIQYRGRGSSLGIGGFNTSNNSSDNITNNRNGILGLNPNAPSSSAATVTTVTSYPELDRIDWRLAIGEISMNLRRELADKASREEMYSHVRTEMDAAQQKLAFLQKTIDATARASEVGLLSSELNALKHRVAGELTGARFLWTTGHIVEEGWVPWDIQVMNAAPAIIHWKKSSTKIIIRIPGLYRICAAMFTTLPAILQIYLNDEPLFSYQPENLGDLQLQQQIYGSQTGGNTAATTSAGLSSSSAAAAGGRGILPISSSSISIPKSNRYYLRRLRHAAGEASCMSIDEYVSLPPEATLSIRYHSATPAQGFFSIKKM